MTLRKKIANDVTRFFTCENGSTMIEYGLIVGLVFLAIVAALKNYSASTGDLYSQIQSAMASAN